MVLAILLAIDNYANINGDCEVCGESLTVDTILSGAYPKSYSSLCKSCMDKYYHHEKGSFGELLARYGVSRNKSIAKTVIQLFRTYEYECWYHRQEFETAILNTKRYKGKFTSLGEVKQHIDREHKRQQDERKQQQNRDADVLNRVLQEADIDIWEVKRHGELRRFYEAQIEKRSKSPYYTRDYLAGMLYLFDTKTYKRLVEFEQMGRGFTVSRGRMCRMALRHHVEDHGSDGLPPYLVSLYGNRDHVAVEDQPDTEPCVAVAVDD